MSRVGRVTLFVAVVTMAAAAAALVQRRASRRTEHAGAVDGGFSSGGQPAIDAGVGRVADGGAAADAAGEGSRRETPITITERLLDQAARCLQADAGVAEEPFGLRFRFSPDRDRPPVIGTWGAVPDSSRRCLDEVLELGRDHGGARSGAEDIVDVTIQNPWERAPLPAGFELWSTGSFYEEEVSEAQRESDWVALCRRGRRFVPVPTRVRSREVDTMNGPGLVITSPDCKGASVPLLKGIEELRRAPERADASADAGIESDGGGAAVAAGAAGAADLGTPVSAKVLAGKADEDAGVTFAFAGKRFRLWNFRDQEHSWLILEQGRRSQVLVREEPAYSSFDLAWAGDLDGDGKLDLIVREYWGALSLFLSRDADARFVRLAYFMSKLGC